MGVDLGFEAELKPKGIFRKTLPKDREVFFRITETIQKNIDDKILRSVFDFATSKDGGRWYKDPKIGLSEAEIKELKENIKQIGLKPESKKTPAPTGIGYRRYDTWKKVGPWKIRVPGYFDEILEDKKAGWVHGDRVIMLKYLPIDRAKAQQMDSRLMVQRIHDRANPEAQHLEYENGDLFSHALKRTNTKDGPTQYYLGGVTAADHDAIQFNIRYDGENDLEWAVKTWHSLNLIK